MLTDAEASLLLGDPAATWLWRSLREAEAAGLDGPAVLRRAVMSGPLGDAESLAKVLDWRIRQQTVGMPAVAARPWQAQVPDTGHADLNRYARELAAAMENRQRRLGEHAAEHQPLRTLALGPVPDHPLDRADWEHRAAQIAGYREMWGWTHPHEPIGPQPGQHSPEARTSWRAAAEALGYQPGSLREHSDGKLWVWRSVFAREMAWAPPYKGDDLAIVRAEIRRTEVEADRAPRNAEVADTDDARQRLTDRADVLAQWAQMTSELASRLADAQTAYDEWERATAPSRDRAVAANAELRRRYPDQSIEPLEAGQPAPEPEPPATEPVPATAGPVPASWPDLGPQTDRLSQIALQNSRDQRKPGRGRHAQVQAGTRPSRRRHLHAHGTGRSRRGTRRSLEVRTRSTAKRCSPPPADAAGPARTKPRR